MSSFLYRKVIKGMYVYNLHEVIFFFIMAQKSRHSRFWQMSSVERCITREKTAPFPEKPTFNEKLLPFVIDFFSSYRVAS